MHVFQHYPSSAFFWLYDWLQIKYLRASAFCFSSLRSSFLTGTSAHDNDQQYSSITEQLLFITCHCKSTQQHRERISMHGVNYAPSAILHPICFSLTNAMWLFSVYLKATSKMCEILTLLVGLKKFYLRIKTQQSCYSLLAEWSTSSSKRNQV